MKIGPKDNIRGFDEITKYRKALKGQIIDKVSLVKDRDEGLLITFESGRKLYFGFSGNEGDIKIE